MQRPTRPRAFSPLLVPPGAPAARATDPDRRRPGAAARVSFAPVTGFHKATQKPFSSTKRVRWSALHVGIAWRIYYHKQLQKVQQKPNSLHPELTPEYLATGPLGPVQPDESAINPKTGFRYERTADRNEKVQPAEHSSRFNKGSLSDLHTSSSRHIHLTKREKRENPPNLHWKEKLDGEEKRGGQQVETTKDLTPGDKSRARSTTPEPDDRHGGSRDRKRKRECDGSGSVKMVRREAADDRFDSSRKSNTDPSPFGATHARPSAPARPDVSAFYSDSSRCKMSRPPGGLAPYPGAQMHLYQTASWEPMWDIPQRMDLHRGQNVQKDYSLNTCKAIRTLLTATRQKEAFFRPLYFPLALRQQEPVYLAGREFLHSGQENFHLHRAGYLASSYLEP
nr:autism susceptibility gene 2 protein homolog isoform X2 [Gasterosteus aculeatus aculeatus]XP_040034372.1 autism susceptibility gene 2 protein homolog isoform X2 [Gasterosteus aculeatus aculeatus]